MVVCLSSLRGTKGNYAVVCSHKLNRDLQFMIKKLVMLWMTRITSNSLHGSNVIPATLKVDGSSYCFQDG